MSGLSDARTDDKSGIIYRKMLILDDDAGVGRTVSLMARRLGLCVETCSTVTEFEAKLSAFNPDVLLIDLMMPGVDGLDAIARIRPVCNAAIFIMSGADKRTCEASRDVLRSASEQIEGFLHKPFSVTELAEALSKPQVKSRHFLETGAQLEENEFLDARSFEKLIKEAEAAPYFQPIFHAKNQSLKGFESLLRIGRNSGNKFPIEYFQYLKNNSVLSSIASDMVIRQSLRFLAGLPLEVDVSISINVFGMDAVANGFRERLIDNCAEFGVAPQRVILELNEGTLCEFDEADMRKITQLRLAGFGLSIDDFGTQNSSLRRLADLPFSELKIDKSFCLALPASEPVEAIVEACLGIAHKLGMEVTAEGVETGEVVDMLTGMGCDALQGYYFGQAMPSAQAADWLAMGCPLPGR